MERSTISKAQIVMFDLKRLFEHTRELIQLNINIDLS